MNEVLKKYEQAQFSVLSDLSTEELREYQTALQIETGGYVKAYRIYNDRLRKVGQELEARKTEEQG